MIGDDIKYWVIALKSYASNFALDLAKQEKFGQEFCDCKWSDLILACRLIDIMECYTVSSQVNGPTPVVIVPDTCLTDKDMGQLFESASMIINRNGKCS